jgi:adenosylcobinamide-phosphate synthase
MTLTIAALLMASALALDALLGEPRRGHPLVGFGRWAQWLEARLHADSRGRGLLAVALTVLPFVALAVALSALPGIGVLVQLGLLYLCIGHRSLHEHAQRVRDALAAQDIEAARTGVAMMVSRDCAAMDATQVATATTESVLENGNDAVTGALFWFLLLGAPGAVLYRLVNTLDAMWGYRNARYRRFGWAAARLDDLLNWLPARLTALSYALLGNTAAALRCWRRQAPAWDSPNAGPVMAAGAGALALQLGGGAMYHGEWLERPALGEGAPPDARAIGRAQSLLLRTVMLWLLLLALPALWLVAHG